MTGVLRNSVLGQLRARFGFLGSSDGVDRGCWLDASEPSRFHVREMPTLNLSRWLSRFGSASFEGARHRARLDARAREAFNLSRWFAGIGVVTDDARKQQESPEADARIRIAVETLPVTLFEFDSRGIYTSVAGGYVGMFGITAAQIVGRSVFDFPRFVPGKNLMVRRALGGEAVSFTGIWPLGRFMIRLQPRLDSDGRVTAVVGLGFELSKPMAADTEIEQLLGALQQSEARFRAMCESAPLGIFVGNSRLELGYVNPALCALVGRKPEELLGRHWQTALHADESERQFIVTGASRAPYAHDGVLRLVRNDGTLVWTSLRIAEMRDGIELLGYVGAITDITKERDARLAMDRAQQDLRRVIESSPEGIAVAREGRWIFANRAMAESLGYARAGDLIGKHSAEIAHPDDRARAIELTDTPSSRDDVHELRYRRANGGYALMEVRPAVLTEFDGAPAVLITARDVTERRKLQAQLLVTERLISVGTLAAGVAHEINNPLAAVLGNLDWVATRLSRLSDPPSGSAVARAGLVTDVQRLEEAIGQAREAAGRVREIVRDLKMFSRAEEELRGPVDLAQVLDSAARMAWNEVRHRARFVREYGALPAVQGSDARLGQVFLNLFINAAQAIPEGNVDQHEIRVSASCPSEDRVVVEVRDTGSGIPADVIGRIFDPFFTTKPPGFGTGLGLAICHKIVTSVGGHIDVESRPGRGTAFSVTLVVAAPDRPAVTASVPPTAPSQLRGRVLVIDDDPSMGKAIALVLGEEHDVDVFTSARAALAELQAGVSYDAVVCDVMMPEMSGVDFHAELSNTHLALSKEVIFLTGGAFTVRARDFLDRVPNPRLDKPFDSERFRALVNRQMSRTIGARLSRRPGAVP
jgi:PAS domain S-box-containing protein